MSLATLRGLVSTAWLAQRIHGCPSGEAAVRIIDASYHLPTTQRNAKKEYLEQHIEGAGFFDLDEIKDNSSSLPHMLPDPALFSKGVYERKMESIYIY